MNDAENTQGMARSTEQIARAGADGEDRASFAGHLAPDAESEQPRPSFEPAEPGEAAEPAEPGGLAEPRWRPFSDTPTTPDVPEQMTGAAHPELLIPAKHAARGGDVGANGQPRTQLLEDNELRSIREQWKEIQSDFVDEPTRAIQDADALVAELMQRLAQMFASERKQLESRWSGGDDVSLEELRTGLRRYRSFFERLLAA